MSEAQQTLGQIAKAAFIERLSQSSPILQSDSDSAWEAAANAVAEECAKAIDAVIPKQASGINIVVHAFAHHIRALKSEGHES